MVFRWDASKAATNLKKHGIDFHEAATVLSDTLSTTFPDRAHSILEPRFVTIGISRLGHILVVVHTEAVAPIERGNVIRIISARSATSHERRFYEED